jgi:hypothetical protein
MAKMLQLLLDWEYPHWMMVAGAILVVVGFVGLAFCQNRNGPVLDSRFSRIRQAPAAIGKLLGRSEKAIRNRLHRLGVPTKRIHVGPKAEGK